MAAQDKYALKVLGGLAFSEVRGYETWQAISVSRKESAVAIVLGNPAMIDAYKAGIPGNGKAVPDGSKVVKDPLGAKAERLLSGCHGAGPAIERGLDGEG